MKSAKQMLAPRIGLMLLLQLIGFIASFLLITPLMSAPRQIIRSRSKGGDFRDWT
jgi:hypothetical protein